MSAGAAPGQALPMGVITPGQVPRCVPVTNQSSQASPRPRPVLTPLMISVPGPENQQGAPGSSCPPTPTTLTPVNGPFAFPAQVAMMQ